MGYPVIAINTNDPEVSPGDNFDAMVARAKRPVTISLPV
jgi:hypothetical protein